MNGAALPAGARVLADGKPGTVIFVRMAPPAFNKPDAYSVALDERIDVWGYRGTIFAADMVVPLIN